MVDPLAWILIVTGLGATLYYWQLILRLEKKFQDVEAFQHIRMWRLAMAVFLFGIAVLLFG